MPSHSQGDTADRNFQAVNEWLSRLLEADATDQPALLKTVPETFRAEVTHLLDAALEPDGFLEPGGGLVEELATPLAATRENLQGHEVGAYRILREIGRGGMGRVYLGERADGLFERQVAVKVVHVDASPPDREALLRELNILARLNHPGIARLYDAGLTAAEADPYFVMEQIQGQPITDYCRESKLSIEDRLRLAVDVCSAVEAAHQQLIVHRDLKPSNILVDTNGVTKLLDFGISRILDHTLTEPTLGTSTEVNLESPVSTTHRRSWLTPRYASPEQLRGEAVSTASDIYQLGLLIRELTTGTPPPDNPESAHKKTPERTAHPPQKLPGRLAASDLTAIVDKATTLDPGDRYRSADRLREDLENLLAGRPVLARPQTVPYRLRRLVARNQRITVLIAATVTVLLSLSGSFTWQLASERDATRQQAEAADLANQETQQVLNYLTEIFQASNPFSSLGPESSDRETTARELLDRSVDRLSGALHEQPLVKARILTVVGGVYRSLGHYEEAETLILQGLALREQTPGDHRQDIAESWMALGNLLDQKGEYDRALAFIEQAVAFRRTQQNVSQLASALQMLGRIQVSQANPKLSIESLTEAIELWQQAGRPDREGEALASLADSLTDLRQNDEAMVHLERSIQLLSTERGENHPSLIAPLVSLANFHSDGGAPDQAIPILEQVAGIIEESLGANDHRLATVHNNLGVAHTRLENLDQAKFHLLESLNGYRSWRPDHPNVGEILNNIGTIEWELERPAEAEVYYRQALEVLRATYPDDHPAVSRTVFNLGEALLGQGDLKNAKIELTRSLELFVTKLGPKHPMVSYPQLYLAEIAESRGDLDSAEALLINALEVRRNSGVEDPDFLRETDDAYSDFLDRHERYTKKHNDSD